MKPTAIIHWHRGRAYFNKGDYDSAIRDFGKAIEIKPMFSPAYRDRKEAYLAKGDCDPASVIG